MLADFSGSVTAVLADLAAADMTVVGAAAVDMTVVVAAVAAVAADVIVDATAADVTADMAVDGVSRSTACFWADPSANGVFVAEGPAPVPKMK